ncbi:hypothetical protein AB0H28_27540 [Micromonospora sp. NPDC050980]|uniref:hypothetical protein n=1 Tax=Micromonospora sp. NPDC050980 TaxID=3155161 RepID=UPI0033C5AB98
MRTRARTIAATAAALAVLTGALLVPRWTGDTRDDELTVTASGYFFVGGQQATDDSGDRTSTIWTGQAMVHQLVPADADKPPVIMMPGLGLSSSIFLTTPDGRVGWAQQAARAGHPAPTIAVYGDRIAERRQTGRLDACRRTVGLVDTAGHPARLVYLPDEGVRATRT